MPPKVRPDTSPTGGEPRPPSPAATLARVADLTPLAGLAAIAAAAPGAEPDRGELVGELKGGRQPYPVLTHGNTLLYGVEMQAAAEAAGVDTVEARGCPGCDGLDDRDLLVKSAGLHLRAVLDRRRPIPARRPAARPAPLDARLLGALLYEALVPALGRRPPRPTPAATRAARVALRGRLIREAFGRAQRTLERDVALAGLPAGLRDAVRRGRLPEKHIEPAARLAPADRKRLAARLADGVPFADLAEEYFGAAGGRRKTERAANAFVRAAIRQVVAELDGREDGFGLAAADRPVARRLAEILEAKLAEPLPADAGAELAELARLAAEVGRRTPAGAATAAGGGRGAAGDRS